MLSGKAHAQPLVSTTLLAKRRCHVLHGGCPAIHDCVMSSLSCQLFVTPALVCNYLRTKVISFLPGGHTTI